MNDPKSIARLIAETMMINEVPPEQALPGMSMALLVSAYEIGIPRELLKERMSGDIDIVYDLADKRKKEMQ